MDVTISGLMKRDHQIIIGLLGELEANTSSDPKITLQLFENFKWKLDLHMFIEEHTIFETPAFSKESDEMVKRIRQEHIVLLDILKSLERKLLSGSVKIVISDFKGALEEHRAFEDNELYPRLDRELEPKTKEFIISQLGNRLTF